MPRLALVSDIHGNCVDLDAVLADARVHDAGGIVCLGDVAAGGPQPRELFSIRGFLELLDEEELDRNTQREFLRTTREQLDRLTRLSVDLLDLSRLDVGRMPFSREPVRLSRVASLGAHGPTTRAMRPRARLDRLLLTW
jgi:hypothetical protein